MSRPGVKGRALSHPLLMIVALAVALRAYPWFVPHTLLGVMEVDDGVYYGAAKLLLNGFAPYADFTIVHPPVTSVLLLPFAAMGAAFGDPIGMAAARLAMGAVGVANVVLVYRLALRLPTRSDRTQQAALVAAALYAVMPDAVVAEHTVLLEPLVNLACLSAVLLLGRERFVPTLVAGVLLTAACGVKLFAGAYVVAVLLWLLISHRRQLVAPLVAGLALGAMVMLLPFFVLAPGEFWHDVVVTQLSRPADGTSGGLVKVLDRTTGHVVSLAVVLLLLAAVLVVSLVFERRAPRSPLTFWILASGLIGLAFATSPSYFPHYIAFLVPPLAMVVSRLTAGPTSRWWPQVASTVVLAGLLLVYLGASLRDVVSWESQGDLRVAGALVPKDACVFYEAISLAVAADVLTLPSRDCPSWVDGRGVALTWNTDWPDTTSFYPAGFVADDRWQAETVEQFGHAEFLLLTRSPADVVEWNETTRAYALSHFAPLWSQRTGRVRAELWKRTSEVGRPGTPAGR